MSYDSQDLNDDSSNEEEYMMFEKHKAKNKDASNSVDKVRAFLQSTLIVYMFILKTKHLSLYHIFRNSTKNWIT